MLRERRGRAAAHVILAPIDTVQPCNFRSSSEVSFDVRVCMEGNNEGRMDPERGQLESSSAGTGFETPGQRCLPNLEMGRIPGDGCLLVGVSPNLEGNTFSLTELVIGTRTDSQTSTPSASSKTVFLQMSRKPGNSEPASEETSSLTPVDKGRSHRFEKRMNWYSFLFLGELWAWMPGLFLVLLPVCLFCICFVLFFTTGKSGDDRFSAS